MSNPKTAAAIHQENAVLRAVARASAEYIECQDGTATGAICEAHRKHLLALLKAACPEYLHKASQ